MRVKHCGLLLLFYELLAKMVAIKIFRGFGRILFAMICSSRNVMFAMNYEEDICWPICLFVTHGLAVNRKMYIVIKSNSWINFMLEFLVYFVVFFLRFSYANFTVITLSTCVPNTVQKMKLLWLLLLGKITEGYWYFFTELYFQK